jgi:hypothetical protein
MFRDVRANSSFSPVDFSIFATINSQKDSKTGYIYLQKQKMILWKPRIKLLIGSVKANNSLLALNPASKWTYNVRDVRES